MTIIYRRLLAAACITTGLVMLGGCKARPLPAAVQSSGVLAEPSAPATAEASPSPQVYTSIDPTTHALPAPDRMMVIAKDWRAELIPGSRTYEEILEYCNQRIQHELELTHIAVPEDDPQLDKLQGAASVLIFEYAYRQDVSYSISGFNMSMRFVRLLMPLGQAEGVDDAQELLYSGDELAYYSEPIRIDPPQQELLDVIKALGSGAEAAQ